MVMKYKNYDEVKRLLWNGYIGKLGIQELDSIVIFGCGDIGNQLIDFLEEDVVRRIVCFCDNNSSIWGQIRHGIEISSPKSAVMDHPQAIFVIAVVRGVEDISKQLRSLGVDSGRIRVLNLLDDGTLNREYLSERLDERYYIDDSYLCETSIPVIRSRDENDKRDYRIYIEKKLEEELDRGERPFNRSLMDEYEKVYGQYIRMDEISVASNDVNTTKVLITCSHKDFAVMESDDSDIYIPIQVGKALTDVALYDLKDDDGENISDRNYNYCECSALYWAWKNKYAMDADYLGLRHYRRKFDASTESLTHLKANGIDIVHLDPIYHSDIRSSFVKHTRNENDWDVMKNAIKKHFPDYMGAMEIYENQHFVCGYNMNILRRDIFDEYCEFLFGVLLDVEDHYLKICDRRDRYLGFLAENLFGVFLIKNKNRYKQAITKLVPYIK